jgi:protein archease
MPEVRSVGSEARRDAAARWEHFAHDADVGVRGFGRSPEQAFEQAALAMVAAVTDVDRVAAERTIDVECEAPDRETLLLDWLNALIFEMATRGMCFSRFKVRIDGDHLHGRAWGEPVDRDRHDVAVEPKGATFTALRVARREDGIWLAQCVVDV